MCQDSRETDMRNFLSRPAEENLIALLADKSDKAITMLADKSDKAITILADKSDKAITMLADKSDKAIDAVTEVMKEAGKNFGGVTKEIGGAAKELKDIFYIVKCVIGVSAIGAGFYGIHWAWRR